MICTIYIRTGIDDGNMSVVEHNLIAAEDNASPSDTESTPTLSGTNSMSGVYQCPECSKCYTTQASLKAHSLLHSDVVSNPPTFHLQGKRTVSRDCSDDDRPYKCSHCDMSYKNCSQLTRHKRLHSGERPAVCEYCGKSFRTYNCLYDHRRIHTGEKPYKCQYCDKFFSTRSYRNSHQRIHTGEKRYECEYCGECFTLSSSRRLHRFRHTGEKPYKCKLCAKSFTQPGVLSKHIKNVHEKKKLSSNQVLEPSVSESDRNPYTSNTTLPPTSFSEDVTDCG